MIPKTLHYMWFGSNPMPRICGECIESWHKVLPSDWSFQFWNEDNYDVEINNFALQAYRSGNYAFVSDYARWDIFTQDPRINPSHTFVYHDAPYWDSHCLNKDVATVAAMPMAYLMRQIVNFNNQCKKSCKS